MFSLRRIAMALILSGFLLFCGGQLWLFTRRRVFFENVVDRRVNVFSVFFVTPFAGEFDFVAHQGFFDAR